MEFEYRATKYDPAHRDAGGAYRRDEWTSFEDIGRTFGAGVLTGTEYTRVENAYVAAAVAFMHEAGVESLRVEGLENHGRHPLPFGEGSVLRLSDAELVIRRVLRGEFWCRLALLKPSIRVRFS